MKNRSTRSIKKILDQMKHFKFDKSKAWMPKIWVKTERTCKSSRGPITLVKLPSYVHITTQRDMDRSITEIQKHTRSK